MDTPSANPATQAAAAPVAPAKAERVHVPVEYLSPERAKRVFDQLDLEGAGSEEQASLRELEGSPDWLEALDLASRTCKARAGLSFRVYFDKEDGSQMLAVSRTWADRVPCETFLCELVARGILPAGVYVVRPRWRNTPRREIRMPIMAALAVAAPTAAPAPAAPSRVEELLAVMLAGQRAHAHPALREPGESASARLEKLEGQHAAIGQALENQARAIEDLSGVVRAGAAQLQTLGAMLQQGGGGGGLDGLVELLSKFGGAKGNGNGGAETEEEVPAGGERQTRMY